MSVVSGKGGKLSFGGSTVSTLGSWKINETAKNAAHAAGNTQGAKTVLSGVRDWSGTAQVYNHNNAVTPGAGLAMIGYNGADESSGNIVVTDLSIDCNLAGGEWITQSIGFAGNGALSHATADSIATDSTKPPKVSAIGAKALWTPYVAGTAGSEAAIPDVEKWSLKIAADVSAYVSSSTAPWTGRATGSSVLSATFSLTFLQGAVSYLTASATRMNTGAFGIMKLYVNASEYWLLDQVCISSNNDLGPDVEGGDYNRVTLTGQWTNYALVSGTMTAGHLTNPATVALWP